MTKAADMLANMMRDQQQLSVVRPVTVPPITAIIPIEPLKNKKVKVGRPTSMTPDVCRKIEEVAALDGTVEEMAIYGGIHRDTLYAYFKQNPDFSDRIEALRQRPILKARNTVINALSDPHHAQWYLERKARKEFSPKGEVDLT